MSRTLYIGDRWLSSWSLRPYLALAHAGLDFDCVEIALDRPDTAAQIARVSPSGRVPVLHDGARVIWDSLAICEYAAELAPAASLWPADPGARAHARAVACEMHAGFAALRRDLPHSLGGPLPGAPGLTAESEADVQRILAIWDACRAAVPDGAGPFLFGSFSIADAMYAPVVNRFAAYGVSLEGTAAAYAAAIAALPAMQRWRAEATLR